VSFTQDSGPPTGGTLPAGGSQTFTLVANVNSNVPAGTTLTNTANGSTTTADPDPTNNSADSTSTVVASADLQVTKTGPASVTAGTNVTYTITFNNAGPSDAQNVTLSDALPAGTTFVSEAQTSGPAFTCVNPPAGTTGTVSCSIGTLAAGASANFTIVVAVN